MEELKQIKDLIAEERAKKLHVVKERTKQRRGSQRPYVGANKRSKERRALNDKSRGITDAQIIQEYKNEVKRLRERIEDNAVARADYIVYYSCLTLTITTIITWTLFLK